VDLGEEVRDGVNWEVLTSVDLKSAWSKEGKHSQIPESTSIQLQEVMVDCDAKGHMPFSQSDLVQNAGEDGNENLFIIPDLSFNGDASFALI